MLPFFQCRRRWCKVAVVSLGRCFGLLPLFLLQLWCYCVVGTVLPLVSLPLLPFFQCRCRRLCCCCCCCYIALLLLHCCCCCSCYCCCCSGRAAVSAANPALALLLMLLLLCCRACHLKAGSAWVLQVCVLRRKLRCTCSAYVLCCCSAYMLLLLHLTASAAPDCFCCAWLLLLRLSAAAAPDCWAYGGRCPDSFDTCSSAGSWWC